MLNLNQKKIYKNLLFDADGTLLDFDKAERRAIDQTFKKFNIPFEYEKYYKMHNHVLWTGLEDNIIEPDFILYKRFDFIMNLLKRKNESDKVVKFYNSIISEGYDLLEDANEVIHELYKRNYNIIIITNGLAKIQHKRFSNIAFTPLLSNLCISGELNASKPHTKFFDKVFEVCDLTNKEECIVIGDRLQSDILGAHNYNLDSVWYNPQKEKLNIEKEPTYEVDSLKKLLNIFK